MKNSCEIITGPNGEHYVCYIIGPNIDVVKVGANGENIECGRFASLQWVKSYIAAGRI